MIIRTATTTDGPNLARIQLDTWRVVYRGLISDTMLETHTVQEREGFWAERLGQARGSVFLAEERSIIGFCDFVPSEDRNADPETVGEIAGMYVQPDHWREGTGRALCDCVLATARQQGYRAVTLWAFEAVAAARDFYRAMGFSPDGGRSTLTLPDGSDLPTVRFRIVI